MTILTPPPQPPTTTRSRVRQRGWQSSDLPAVPPVDTEPGLWTAEEASVVLGPPKLTPDQVRQLVRIAGIQPVGKRRSLGHRGRHARVYRAHDLVQAFKALAAAAGTAGP